VTTRSFKPSRFASTSELSAAIADPRGSCSSDVATWFEVASDGCEADGGTASYSASHASDYVFSTAAAAAETSEVSAASAASSAAASATPSGGAMSNAPQLGAIAAVVGALLL
jgi:hypothetical protein